MSRRFSVLLMWFKFFSKLPTCISWGLLVALGHSSSTHVLSGFQSLQNKSHTATSQLKILPAELVTLCNSVTCHSLLLSFISSPGPHDYQIISHSGYYCRRGSSSLFQALWYLGRNKSEWRLGEGVERRADGFTSLPIFAKFFRSLRMSVNLLPNFNFTILERGKTGVSSWAMTALHFLAVYSK